MAREIEKDEPIVPSWNGEAAGWPDYSRRVRLCHAQTPYGKRYTLGPKLVLKLRGKAWEIAAGIDHDALETHGGAQYLLQYLREKLGKLPVPDVGQHLDELFVRVKRHPGVDMVTWCNQVKEAYKKLQRALARTKPGMRTNLHTDRQGAFDRISSWKQRGRRVSRDSPSWTITRFSAKPQDSSARGRCRRTRRGRSTWIRGL